MNWKVVLIYGAGLSVAQFVIGVAAGLFGAGSLFSLWDLASFTICTALFAHLAIHNKLRPLAHALMVLAFYGGTSLALAALTLSFLGGLPPMLLVGIEWLNLVGSMAIGLTIGIAFRPASRNSNEA